MILTYLVPTLIALFTVVPYFLTYEQNYNCTLLTHVFGLVYPIVVLAFVDTQQEMSFAAMSVIGLSCCMIVFHLTYQFKSWI